MADSSNPIFTQLCNTNDGLHKISFIRKYKGHWIIVSKKGKVLGKYKTKQEAVRRLRQIEFFKHLKKATKSSEVTYSALMRKLNKQDPELLYKFRKSFKEKFDEAMLAGEDHPEDVALESATPILITKASIDLSPFIKRANELGDPDAVGQYLSQLIRFILRRISAKNRPRSIESLKRKIYLLNEFDLANKRMPASASLGTVLTLVKHILFKHPAPYVRSVLNSIVRYL